MIVRIMRWSQKGKKGLSTVNIVKFTHLPGFLPVKQWIDCCRSFTQSCLTLCNPMGWQHTRLPCPSPSPGVCSNLCPLSWGNPYIYTEVIHSCVCFLHCTMILSRGFVNIQRIDSQGLYYYTSLGLLSGEGNGNPVQCSCLENPMDGGAWWAAVYGVAQSWTRLKWRRRSSIHCMDVSSLYL